VHKKVWPSQPIPLSQFSSTEQADPSGTPSAGGLEHTPGDGELITSEQLFDKQPASPLMHFAPAPPHIPSVPQKK